jgi:RES domain-containing protein
MWSGAGSRFVAGRWNSKGTVVVYTAGSVSLAALETLVHLQSDEVLAKFLKCSVTFNQSLVSRVKPDSLPRSWRRDRPSPALQAIGDTWARDGKSPVLAVPSVIVPEEFNYLLNPEHPDFSKILMGHVEPFGFDPRLVK